MIGVSLPFAWLVNDNDIGLDRDLLLKKLKENGTRSIELRPVRATSSPEDVKKAAELLWRHGFTVSIHGQVKTKETAIEDVFSPLQKVLLDLKQPTLNVTIHPIDGDNAGMLNDLADHIENNSYPVTIALENNRLMPDKTEGDSAALVLQAVTEVDRKSIGICFDFGHYVYYRLKNHPEEPILFPPKAFFQRVIHTHIHALNGLTTHFPLKGYNMPLKEIFAKLSFEYFGIYNLELDFPRFIECCGIEEALIGSLETLNENLPICARVYDEVRDNFDERFTSALKALDGDTGIKFSLIHSSSYLFNTNGYRWGMDVAFRNARILAKTPSRCADLLKDLSLMVISHSHSDHFEQSTIKALAKTSIEWVIPDFLYDLALQSGIYPARIHIAKENQPLTVGALTFIPFKGRHFRPGTTNGVPEYGYFVTAENAPSIVFPVDVRDLSLNDLPSIPKADYCFANVWLGDRMALATSYDPIDRQFSEFMLNFSDKNIILTHLNENGRMDQDMWRDRHGEIVKARLCELSPNTIVSIPKSGEVMELK